MTLYPHQWLWQKIEPHSEFICIASTAVVVALILCGGVIWAAAQYPTANLTYDPIAVVAQPSVFSYAPIVVTTMCMIIAMGVVSYFGRAEK